MAATNNNSKLGLSTLQVHTALKKFGYNEIPKKREYKVLKILLAQFSSFLILVLIIAGAISISVGETIDGLAILAIVLINATIGFIQEYKADNAVNALTRMIVEKTIVIRNGIKQEVNIRELVPNDIVILNEGDKIPADLELIESFAIKVDESMLTGESVPVNKLVTSGKEGTLFKGTIISSGRGMAKVISTGINTEFGKIINLISKQKSSSSPLTVQLDNLGKKLAIVTIVLVSIVFILGFIEHISFVEMFMTSVSLGVSAIPEGMPIIVTLTLAMGIQALARKKAIVRKMNSIETLGATTIICSDKTGTLTLNEMTVKKINCNFLERSIDGVGYSYSQKFKPSTVEEKKLLEICENCNSSYVDKNGKTLLGDPTEIALKILTRKAGYIKLFKEVDEKPFSSERKMMSVLIESGKQKEIMTKGAFEEIIKKSSHIYKDGKVQKISAQDKRKYEKIAEAYASKSLRVLGFAYKPHTKDFSEENLIFVGLVGMLDPPRKSVKASIEIAQKAGILIRIITGDNAITAKAIGEEIGLTVNNVITGEEIDKMTNSQLRKAIQSTEIFARTKPEHKYRIVEILKKSGHVVAVTGDGVNDAPALKHADVGIAMGIKGTEATKEVADIILKDDNFSTIVNTIKEGRRIYKNILAFIKYMLSANFITIMVVAILTALGFPLPILPLQILWLNIATDALPALALGQSPAAENIMLEKPHPKQEHMFQKFLSFILTAALVQTIANLAIYFYGTTIDIASNIDTSQLNIASHARTMVFTQTVVFELFFALVCKDEKNIKIKSLMANKSLLVAIGISFILQIIMIYQPFMQSIFKTTPLEIKEWGIIILAASTAFIIPTINNTLKQFLKK